jgi:hypothetical protein
MPTRTKLHAEEARYLIFEQGDEPGRPRLIEVSWLSLHKKAIKQLKKHELLHEDLSFMPAVRDGDHPLLDFTLEEATVLTKLYYKHYTVLSLSMRKTVKRRMAAVLSYVDIRWPIGEPIIPGMMVWFSTNIDDGIQPIKSEDFVVSLVSSEPLAA